MSLALGHGHAEPATPVEQTRYDLAVELLAEVQRLDAQLKESHRRIRIAVKASDTTLTDLFGVGPVIARYLIGFTGDVRRFTNRDQFAAYNGTAPVERSSDGRTYFERKLAEGKTKKEALRALKRHISNAVYRQLLIDANRAAR